MRVKANNFSTGIINWVEPYALPMEAAVDLLDADVKTTGIRSQNADGPAGSLPELFNYRTASRSVVNWSNEFYWTDNDTGEFGSTLGYVGVDPPDNIPSVAFGKRGTKFVGTYQYLATYTTNEGWESAPQEIRNTPFAVTVQIDPPEAEIEPGTYPAFNAQRVHPLYDGRHSAFYGYSAGERVVYGTSAYQCQQTFHNGRIADVGDAAYVQEDQFPDVNTNLWRDIGSTTVTSGGYDEMIVTIPSPTEAIITGLKLYRTIANGAVFYLVAELARDARVYTDTLADEEIQANQQFTLFSAMPPIYTFENQKWSQVGAKYLTELNGVFYCAVGDRVYASDQNNPHAWSPSNYTLYEAEVTAIARETTAVIVFTANRTYRLTGTTLADTVREDLQVNQGCPNWRTITYFRNMPVWMSFDGLCGYSTLFNREGKLVSILTEGKYRFATQPTFAESANDIYYGFYADHAVCFDLKQNLLTYRRSMAYTDAYYDRDTDRLLLYDDTSWFEESTGDALTWTYWSPEISIGELTVQKDYRRLWINSTGVVTCGVWLDGEYKQTITFSGAGRRNRYLQPNMIGDRLQLRFSGTGVLHSFEVELNPMLTR
jgi:hypothetical protein